MKLPMMGSGEDESAEPPPYMSGLDDCLLRMDSFWDPSRSSDCLGLLQGDPLASGEALPSFSRISSTLMSGVMWCRKADFRSITPTSYLNG